jgi:splicing factor U2AF subunit
MWQLQQLEARAMVLEQQAKSAATATSKTQREVYVGGLIPGTFVLLVAGWIEQLNYAT